MHVVIIHKCRLTDRKITAMNMGSYNYLGFAQTSGPCADDAERVTLELGTGSCGSRHELGKFTRAIYCASVAQLLRCEKHYVCN